MENPFKIVKRCFRCLHVLGEETADSPDEQNELDTAYMRSKETILRQFVVALMAEDTDLQSALKDELKELDAAYDAQKKGE